MAKSKKKSKKTNKLMIVKIGSDERPAGPADIEKMEKKLKKFQKYGVGMVRRLFPILSYKTKLMVAQWIIAERLIVPTKIIKEYKNGH